MSDDDAPLDPINKMIEDFVESQLSPSAFGQNFNVYDERLTDAGYPQFKRLPHTIYFYYVRINRNGGLVVDHYFYQDLDTFTGAPKPILATDLTKYAEMLVANARPIVQGSGRVRNPEPLPDRNFNGILWNRVSYIMIFMDEALWTLHKKGSRQPPIVFNVGQHLTPNHSFFDAVDLDVPMPEGGTRTAVAFINHMKINEFGADFPKHPSPDQNFKFDIFFDVRFADGTSAPMTVIFDPGGTNTGPPVPPPEE